jgi:hypothetical protein
MLELNRQTFLIDCFEKAGAFFVVYLEACANDRVTLFLVNDFCHFYWRESASFAGLKLHPVRGNSKWNVAPRSGLFVTQSFP